MARNFTLANRLVRLMGVQGSGFRVESGMTHTPLQSAKHRWTPRLRFSLRLLLLSVTAFAIGFPIWYRWPYDEVESHYPERSVNVGGKWELVEDKNRPYERITTTLRRRWGSLEPEVVRRQIELMPPLDTRTISHYQRGQLHGAYQYFEKGELIKEGQYERGQREGVWVERRYGATYTVRWHRDRLDGLYERQSAAGHEQLLFKNGRVIGKAEVPQANHLLEFLESGQAKSDCEIRIAKQLQTPTELPVEFVETPLVDAVAFLQDANALPFEIDRRHLQDVQLPIAANYGGLDLYTTLALMLAPHGLACDCRYSALWITTADDARDWRDPTGVSQLIPPPGSALAEQWDRNLAFAVEAADLPLATVLDGLFKDLKMEGELDTSQISGTAIRVTAGIRGRPFRHVLGNLLYATDCRCKWEQGKLVILPPESAKSK